MVLDGNMLPGLDVAEFSEDDARAMNQRIDYFIAACEIENVDCGVKDMRSCVSNLDRILRDNRDDVEETFNERSMGFVMMRVLSGLFANVDKVPSVCTAAAEDDYAQLKAIMLESDQDKGVYLQITCDDFDSESKPTSGVDFCRSDWPFEGYQEYEEATFTIWSEDYTFGAYDEDLFVR